VYNKVSHTVLEQYDNDRIYIFKCIIEIIVKQMLALSRKTEAGELRETKEKFYLGQVCQHDVNN